MLIFGGATKYKGSPHSYLELFISEQVKEIE